MLNYHIKDDLKMEYNLVSEQVNLQEHNFLVIDSEFVNHKKELKAAVPETLIGL